MKRFKPLLNKDIMLILASSFLYSWSSQLLIPTFPLYITTRGGDEKLVGLLTGLFAFTAVFVRPILGKMMDKRGRKFVLFLSLIVAATGPLLYALGTSFFLIGLARIYHAISLAGFITAAQTLTADLCAPKARGLIVSISGVVHGIALASAPYLGFLIYNRFGFAPLFVTSSLMAAGALPLVTFVKEPERTPTDDQRGSAPLLRVLGNRWVVIPCLALFTVTLGQGAINAFLPLHGLSVGVTNISIFFTFYSIASMVTSAISALLSSRFTGKLALLGLVFIMLGSVGLSQFATLWELVLYAILMGSGFALTYNILLTLILNKINLAERAQGVSSYANAFDLGISTGSMALGVIAAFSFSSLWLLVAAVTFLGFLLTLLGQIHHVQLGQANSSGS